jgi:hypothetical protein
MGHDGAATVVVPGYFAEALLAAGRYFRKPSGIYFFSVRCPGIGARPSDASSELHRRKQG